MADMFKATAKFYFNTPEMLARLGKWRNDILARVGAYGRGVFRNSLGRPQNKQTKNRTVYVHMFLYNRHGGRYIYSDMVFVPRSGPVTEIHSGKPAPMEVAAFAMYVASKRIKGEGAGKPPRMGPTKNLRRGTDFSLDPDTESVVIGTVKLPILNMSKMGAASVGQLLNEGLVSWVESAIPGASKFASYAAHPYVEAAMPRTQAKLEHIIQQKKAG